MLHSPAYFFNINDRHSPGEIFIFKVFDIYPHFEKFIKIEMLGVNAKDN